METKTVEVELIVETIKNQLEEKYGSNNLKEIYEVFKKLRSSVQKAKSKFECLNDIKEDLIITYLEKVPQKEIQIEKLDLFVKILQKSCQRLEDRIKINLNENLNKPEYNKRNNNDENKNKKSNDILDKNSNQIFLKKIKNFEKNFLKSNEISLISSPLKSKSLNEASNSNSKIESQLLEIGNIIENFKIFNICYPLSQKGIENYTLNSISDLKEQLKKSYTSIYYPHTSFMLKEKFVIFLFEELNNNSTGIKLINHFTKYLQKCEVKYRNQLELITYPKKNKRFAIYFFPFIFNQEENPGFLNNYSLDNFIIVCFINPVKNECYYLLQNSISYSDSNIKNNNFNEKVFLSFNTLKQMKNSKEIFEEYLQDYIIENKDFNFYFDIKKFKSYFKHENIIKGFLKDYSEKFDDVDIISYEKKEIFDVEMIKELFFEYSINLLHSNNYRILKGVFSTLGMNIIDKQII